MCKCGMKFDLKKRLVYVGMCVSTRHRARSGKPFSIKLCKKSKKLRRIKARFFMHEFRFMIPEVFLTSSAKKKEGTSHSKSQATQDHGKSHA
ncbi:hypothetical protein HanXRQr2_Chr07g0313911 [Helianthus annuus]|uniref:Uncharacterized protein n=1 Tax=Helianthus annuus TaxID=4232 RepID=A0A251U456_HELAN|nr:hypothetical protein HanXRQr2_Chr07g0313911 [Helianthus annuus]